jgi:hypothetical protein
MMSHFYYSSSSSIEYISDRYITMGMNKSDYTGGAHGNYGTTLLTFDRKTQKEITHTDLFSTEAFEKLGPILETYYKKQYGLQDDEPVNETLLVESIEPTVNCGIVGRGVLFMYNPYEIASYAQGIQEIWLPFDVLKGYMNPVYITQ